MPLEKFKDVEIGGLKFRIGLVTALVGDWIENQMLTKRFLDEAVYQSIQNRLLGLCSIFAGDDAPPLRIFDNGRWLVAASYPDLPYDTETVHALIDAALEFNFGPFLKKLVEAQQSGPTPATSL